MIDFLPDEAQQQVLDSFQEVLAREAPVARLRQPAAAPGPRDARLWPQMAQLGWLGLGLAEADGGVGMDIAEEMLLCVQAGRHLVSPALVSTLVGAQLAVRAGRPELARRIAGGRTPVAIASPVGRHELGPQCSGRFHCVDAAEGGWLLAWNATGAALLEASGALQMEAVPGFDESLRVDVATIEGVRALAWVPAGEAPLALRATVLVAAMLAGAAHGAKDLAVAYAKTREQFGRPIGAFQAIKHQCADMAVRAEAAQSQVTFAALALREGRPDVALQAAAAKVTAVDAATENGAAAVRVHGGMGFTEECDAHLFLKRAHVLNQLGGNQRQQLMEILRQPRAV